jgi:hypothetical protein
MTIPGHKPCSVFERYSPRELMKAATGFEPVDGGFADRSLNHLGTPPKGCTLACSPPAYQHPSEDR